MRNMKSIIAIDFESVYWGAWGKHQDEAVANNATVAQVESLAKGHDHCVIAADSRTPRYDTKGYKARREERKEAWAQRLSTIGQLTQAGYTVLRQDGYEAMDLIYSFIGQMTHAHKMKHVTPSVLIATTTTLLLSLVRATPSKVEVLNTSTGDIFGEGEVFGKFGCLPYHIPDVIALGGDGKGNKDFPGLHQVGMKLAVKTINPPGEEAMTASELQINARQNIDQPDHVATIVAKAVTEQKHDLERNRIMVVLREAKIDLSFLGTTTTTSAETEPPPPVPDPEPTLPSQPEPSTTELPPQQGLQELARSSIDPVGVPFCTVCKKPIDRNHLGCDQEPTVRRPPPQRERPTRAGRFTFTTATREDSRARIALCGPSGSGKTFSALEIAKGLTDNHDRIIVIDTENGSASKYADGHWKQLVLPTFRLEDFIEAIEEVQALADVLIIDSISHAWMGAGGALEQVDNLQKRAKNKMDAWRTVTPMHNKLIEAMIRCKCHLIVTMRVKTEWVIEPDHRGRNVPRKVGTKPVQREGLEYEFDIVGEMTWDHDLIISKTRCVDLDKEVINKPGVKLGAQIKGWLSS